MNELTPETEGKSFEQLKQRNEHGAEYWSARDLQPLLGHSQWRRFENAIQKAKLSCRQSGNEPEYHFAGAGKPIKGGKGAIQEVQDYHLSRFACYLIAQNGDPRKSEIAHAQKYFAIQTRRQELSDALSADRERLEIRKQAILFDVPILEYRPYRSFAATQSTTLLFQLFTAADAPHSASVVVPAGAPEPDLRTVWSAGFGSSSIGGTTSSRGVFRLAPRTCPDSQPAHLSRDLPRILTRARQVRYTRSSSQLTSCGGRTYERGIERGGIV